MSRNRNSQSFAQPNERLKQERILHGWTQADLAGFVGTDGFTVHRWERGRARPSLFFSRKLCEVFGKSAEALGLLPVSQNNTDPSSSQITHGLPALWSVPYPPNPFFTGREEFLETLHSRLGVDQMGVFSKVYALQGLAGTGKTHLALEYAYRYALEYHAVFWIGAETYGQVLSNVLRVAELLQLPEQKEADQQRVEEAVQYWLTTHNGWLLVWDNLEDLSLLQRWLPLGKQGAILITTRSQVLGPLAQGIELAPMGQEEAMLLMLRRARVLEPTATGEYIQQFALSEPDEYAASSKLVTYMGGLPLALDQVGAYIEETGCSFTDYVQRYDQRRVSLLDRRGTFDGGHPHSVTTTFVLAGEQIERELGAAADVLRVCALLHASTIPEELFTAGAAHLGPTLEPLMSDLSQFDQIIAVLRNLSLVQRYPETHTLSLHCLVQTVLQARMSKQERVMWLRRAIAALNALFPDAISHTWKQCQRLLPHVLVAAAALPDDVKDGALAEVLRKAADYFREQAQYEQAAVLYQRALRLGQQTQELEYLVPCVLNGWALLCDAQGEYIEAEQLYQQALHAGKQILGPMHFEVAWSLNNLGGLYKTQGKYMEAETLYLQAKFIMVRALGPEHPKVGYPLINLAEIYFEQGKYEQAEAFCEQALYLWKRTLRPEHSLVAIALLVQAKLFTMQEKYEQTEATYQQALHIRKKTIGSDHPLLADPLNGLANLYVQQYRYPEAEQLYRRALTLREQYLGPHHPETAQTLHDLAILQQKLGNQDKAISFSECALKIRTQSLGNTHPKTVATQALYVQLLQETKYVDSKSQQVSRNRENVSRENVSLKSVVTSNPQALKRSQVIDQLLAGIVSAEQAAEMLGCTLRHLYRLKARYREKGVAAFVHGNSGRTRKMHNETGANKL
jgi:tetratricopeptide (TPR) repeat protein/DNA-binding XRE family transcriptional regulator